MTMLYHSYYKKSSSKNSRFIGKKYVRRDY